ncbi:hypothetical protein SNEBB_006148 [Seison nebaliae]|nr:hypothetical protein SNEBB_006148 [Seison nebaliae]
MSRFSDEHQRNGGGRSERRNYDRRGDNQSDRFEGMPPPPPTQPYVNYEKGRDMERGRPSDVRNRISKPHGGNNNDNNYQSKPSHGNEMNPENNSNKPWGDGDNYFTMYDTVFISGLPIDINAHEIEDFFGQCGVIKNDKKRGGKRIWVYTDKGTGGGKGEATVTYTDADAAKAAIKFYHNQEGPRQKIVQVQLAMRKINPGSFFARNQNGPSAGGGGGGGGGSSGGGGYGGRGNRGSYRKNYRGRDDRHDNNGRNYNRGGYSNQSSNDRYDRRDRPY